MNPRPSGYEPESGLSTDLGKCAKCLLRRRFWFASFRVLHCPIALSCAMDVRWDPDMTPITPMVGCTGVSAPSAPRTGCEHRPRAHAGPRPQTAPSLHSIGRSSSLRRQLGQMSRIKRFGRASLRQLSAGDPRLADPTDDLDLWIALLLATKGEHDVLGIDRPADRTCELVVVPS